ncbi:MAG: DUF427 domain-containing protein [Anaerolineae bacterium]
MNRPTPIKPGPGQESVWDYPRPAVAEPTKKRIQITFNGIMIVDTTRAFRVLETSHPPSYYVPPEDCQLNYFKAGTGRSMCEWKGPAKYYTIEVEGKRAENAAWYYPTPTESFQKMRNYIAFYPAMMDECRVAGEIATPQAGGFYGGWVTKDIVGPIKGEPGTWGW